MQLAQQARENTQCKELVYYFSFLETGGLFGVLNYLSWLVPGLGRCTQASPSCGVGASHCSAGFCFWSTGSKPQASVVAALSCRGQGQEFRCAGLVAPWHVESSRTRNGTRVSCISKQIHCVTRKSRGEEPTTESPGRGKCFYPCTLLDVIWIGHAHETDKSISVHRQGN